MSRASDEHDALERSLTGWLDLVEPAMGDGGGVHGSGHWDGQVVDAMWVPASSHSDWARAVERRRHAPAPPCPPLVECRSDAAGVALVCAQPNGRPIAALPPPGNRSEMFEQLERIAAGIDQLHRYRLAHGQLNDDCVLVEGSIVWLRGVGVSWSDLDRGSIAGLAPQDRDIAYLEDLARRWLSGLVEAHAADLAATLPPSAGSERQTARAVVERLREATIQAAPPAMPAREEAAMAFETLDSAATPARRPIDRLAIAAVTACLVALLGGGLALHFHWSRTADSLPEPVPVRFARVTRAQLCAEMARQVRQQQSIAALEALLATDGAEEIEYLLGLLNDGNPQLRRLLIGAATKIDWDLGKRSKLAALGERIGESDHPVWTHWLLAGCGLGELALVERLAVAPDESVRAAALAALVRLGRPVPVGRLVEEHRRAADPTTRRQLVRLAMTYPESQAVAAFLDAQWIDGSGRPRALLFELAFEHPTAAVARLIDKTLPRVVNDSSRFTIETVVTALASAAKVRRQTPNSVLAALPIEAATRAALERDVARWVLGESGIRARIGTAPLPDDWQASAVAWSGARPLEFLEALYLTAESRVEPLDELRLQSMLLSLANIEDADAQGAVAEKLIARTPWSRWPLERPAAAAAVVTVLAASGAPAAARFLQEFLGTDSLRVSPVFWEAAVVGAALAPQTMNALLQQAQEHPLPAVALRARRALALRTGSLEKLRAVRPAKLPEQGALITLIDHLRQAPSEEPTYLREMEPERTQLVGLALVLCDTPRGAGGLYRRWVGGGANLADTYLLASLEETNVIGLWEGFHLHSQWPSLLQQPMLGTAGMLRDLTWTAPVRRLASGETPTPLPLWHRYLAVRALGEFREGPASMYLEILGRETSLLVQYAAAVGYLLTTPEQDTAAWNALVAQAALHPRVRDALRPDLANLAAPASAR